MLFKNPYIEDSKLSPDQREYLEVVLWTINRHRMYEIDPKTKKLSYKELKESKDFEKYKNAISINNTYLEIPLKLRDGFSTTFTSFVSVIKGKRTLKEFTEKEITKFRARIE